MVAFTVRWNKTEPLLVYRTIISVLCIPRPGVEMKGNYKQTKLKKKNATIKWVSVDLRHKITTCDINEIILGPSLKYNLWLH